MKRIILTLLVVLIGWTAFGQFTLSQTIDNPNALESSETFGSSIAVEGNYMVVGVPYADGLGLNAGMAYLYHYQNDIWNLQTALLPSDTIIGGLFGHDVAIEGDVIVVGTNIDDQGGVFIFEKPETIWPDTLVNTQAILRPNISQARGRTGFSVDVSGDFIAIGSPVFSISTSFAGGQVFMYKKANGDKWSDNPPGMIRRYFSDFRSNNPNNANNTTGFGWDVKFLKDVDQFLIFNYPPFNPAIAPLYPTSGVIRFVDYSSYTSFTSLNMSDSPWFQVIADVNANNNITVGGTKMSYADSVLVYENKIYKLDNTGTYGNFVLEGTLAGNVIDPSVGISENGQLITAMVQGTDSIELVCYKKSGNDGWQQVSNISKKIILPDNRTNVTNELYATYPIETTSSKDFRVIAGTGESIRNGTFDVGRIFEYSLDITPEFIGFFPENGATNIKFTSDTSVYVIFDSPIASTSNAFVQYLSPTGQTGGNVSVPSSTIQVLGDSIKIDLNRNFWSADYGRFTAVIYGTYTDAYGLSLSYPNTGGPSTQFYLGNVQPPTFTTTTSGAVDGFTRGNVTLSFQANDGIDTVASNLIELRNASLGVISRISDTKFDIELIPDFGVDDPEKLNELVVKVPSTFFKDTAGLVWEDSLILALDYSQSIVRKNGKWLDGVNAGIYIPTVSDDVFIAEDYDESIANVSVGSLMIGESKKVSLGGEALLDVNGDFVNEGSLYVQDSASLILQKAYSSGDSIFVKSGASLYTYEGFNHTGKIHAERKNSFGLGKYSFVGTPFEETESNSTAAFGSYVYAYDPTQPYGTDGLAQWVDASAETIIPGRGYTSSSSDTTKLSGTPNCGEVKVTELKYDPNASNNTANLGWQLLSNPYLAPLRVDEMWAANEEALEVEAIYLWDDGGSDQGRRTNSDYLVHNSLGTVGGANGKSFNGMLMPFQAFMVKLLDSIGGGRAAPRIDRIFTFDEDMRAATGGIAGNFFRKTEPAKVKVRVTNTDGLWSETIIGFTEDATLEFDAKYDAYFRSNKEVAIFSLLDDLKLAIQGLPNTSLTEMTEVPIGLQSSGDLFISIVESNGMESIDLYLKDIHTGVLTSLDASSKTIQVSGDLAKSYSLIFKPRVLLSVDNHAMNPLSAWGDNSSVSVLAPELSGWYEVAIYDLTGRVARQEKARFKNGQCTINGLKLTSRNVYVLQIGDQSIKFILN